MAIEQLKQSFIPVATSPVTGIVPEAALINPDEAELTDIEQLIAADGLPVITTGDRHGVFYWQSPLNNLPDDEYPPTMRSFVPVSTSSNDQSLAARMIAQHGPMIPHRKSYYVDKRLNTLLDREKGVVVYEVPHHLGRGFKDRGVLVFETKQGIVIKFTVSTKGNGICGYWIDKRQEEMLDALKRHDGSYPLNPDAFHARDRTGQHTGHAKGDDIIWIGCASNEVTMREVEGFNLYDQCGIFHPICFPVRKFDELPLATGDFIPVEQFTNIFDRKAKLVYLAKAWVLETRIWQSHFSNRKMSAAHLYTTKRDGAYLYENSIQELKTSALSRKERLREEAIWVMKLLQRTDNNHWKNIFGFAGNILARTENIFSLVNADNVIPMIISINMTENVARAGANRLWGKPVAWHLGNVGRLGEVSGGERIYGKANGNPDAMEIHSLFAYIFDAYNAIAIEWASADMSYLSIDQFFQSVKTRILQLNPEHWIYSCNNIDQFVLLCQSIYPQYQVLHRSEDAYPLVAASGLTDSECQYENEYGLWKDWSRLKAHMEKFIEGIRSEYTRPRI